MKAFTKFLLPLAALLIVTTSAQAASLALKGYDPVAYHLENKPVKGSKGFTYTYENRIYQFATAQNLDLFMGEPARYAPAYGGYCAYAAGSGRGSLVEISPSAFDIVGGKLYLNLNKSIQKRWSNNQASFIRKADSNWEKRLKQRVK